VFLLFVMPAMQKIASSVNTIYGFVEDNSRSCHVWLKSLKALAEKRVYITVMYNSPNWLELGWNFFEHKYLACAVRHLPRPHWVVVVLRTLLEGLYQTTSTFYTGAHCRRSPLTDCVIKKPTVSFLECCSCVTATVTTHEGNICIVFGNYICYLSVAVFNISDSENERKSKKLWTMTVL
jgi:hypothetical protein